MPTSRTDRCVNLDSRADTSQANAAERSIPRRWAVGLSGRGTWKKLSTTAMTAGRARGWTCWPRGSARSSAASQREERLEVLDERMAERGIDREHYALVPRSAPLRHGAACQPASASASSASSPMSPASPRCATRSHSRERPETRGIDPHYWRPRTHKRASVQASRLRRLRQSLGLISLEHHLASIPTAASPSSAQQELPEKHCGLTEHAGWVAPPSTVIFASWSLGVGQDA